MSRGSIVKRGGTYSVKVELDPDPVTGRRRQRWHSGYRTKKEAERARVDLLGKLDSGEYVEHARQPLGAYVDDWLTAIEPTVRESTFYSYARNLRLHVVPYLGAMPLTKVDAGALNGLYATLLATGRKDGHHEHAGLSPRSVRYVHTILHRALKDAVRWGGSPVTRAMQPTRREAGRVHRRRSWRGRPRT